MRSMMISLCVLAFACSSPAQTDKRSWVNLSALQPGSRIEVVGTNSKHDSGQFVSVTEAAVTLEEKSGEKTIQRQDVRIVRLMKNKHRLRNTLLGAGIGTGIGAGIGAATYRRCVSPPNSFGCIDFGRGAQSALGAVVGLVGGTVIGAVWPTHEIIYRAD
jgi:hypothetical protein